MDKTQLAIIRKVCSELATKLSMKYSYTKKVKSALDNIVLEISRFILGDSKIKIKKYAGTSSLGCDKYGRDIEDGLHQYVALLKNRNLEIHTVIVLGSRAKCSWKPQSDVDTTIVASNLPKEGKLVLTRRFFAFRRKLLLSDRPLYLGIEPSGCCSESEFLAKIKAFDLQALDAILYGKIIYDDGFWQVAKAKYNEMERKFKLDEIPLKQLLKSA